MGVKNLDARSRSALMMRYSSQSCGYKLWDEDSSKFVVSEDVIFDEICATEESERSHDTVINEDNLKKAVKMYPRNQNPLRNFRQ